MVPELIRDWIYVSLLSDIEAIRIYEANRSVRTRENRRMTGILATKRVSLHLKVLGCQDVLSLTQLAFAKTSYGALCSSLGAQANSSLEAYRDVSKHNFFGSPQFVHGISEFRKSILFSFACIL
jgi:hypothetical protein